MLSGKLLWQCATPSKIADESTSNIKGAYTIRFLGLSHLKFISEKSNLTGKLISAL